MMHKKFQMSSMGKLTFFLGLQVKKKEDGIFISQDKYVTEILKKFDFTDVKTASTPMETQKPLLKDEDGEEVDVHLYRSMIGSLIYLTSLRSDIMFAVVVKTINGEVQLHALVDDKKIIISETSIRRDLKLEDEEASPQPQKTQKPRKPKRKDTRVPQPSDPSDRVADEAVHKELGISLVRVATTASSLEAGGVGGGGCSSRHWKHLLRHNPKQNTYDLVPRTLLQGGGPRCKKPMRDTYCLTRFENVSKLSNDSLLARGNTLQNKPIGLTHHLLKLTVISGNFRNFK
ncbi:uncharacterized mitochondrial protein-like protein [Tanacetum coccineum]